MKQKRFTQEKIIKILKEAEEGKKVADICRKYGISDASFYTWRKKYQGMDIQEAKKLKKLEEENKKLKRLVADQALDILMLKDVVSKKW